MGKCSTLGDEDGLSVDVVLHLTLGGISQLGKERSRWGTAYAMVGKHPFTSAGGTENKKVEDETGGWGRGKQWGQVTQAF